MPREYRQALRAESAERTRRRILQAMDRRLRAKRPQPLTVELVAQDAGVARSTVYGTFGSRAGLFDAYADDLWQRSGLDRLAEVVRVPDARDHLRGGILAASRMFAADLNVFRRLFAMDAMDPGSLDGAVRRMEALRLKGMRHLAERLAEAGRLRPGLDVDSATDVLWVLCSFQAFDLLHRGRGLSVEDAADALASAAERTLCRPAASQE